MCREATGPLPSRGLQAPVCASDKTRRVATALTFHPRLSSRLLSHGLPSLRDPPSIRILSFFFDPNAPDAPDVSRSPIFCAILNGHSSPIPPSRPHQSASFKPLFYLTFGKIAASAVSYIMPAAPSYQPLTQITPNAPPFFSGFTDRSVKRPHHGATDNRRASIVSSMTNPSRL